MRRSGGSRSRRSGLIIEENAHGKDGPSENELAAWSSERPEAHSWTDVSRSEKRMARPERFELPTYSSGGCRSIQLSYGRVIQVYIGRLGPSICAPSMARLVSTNVDSSAWLVSDQRFAE